jgi:hypothetical protein
MDGCVSGRTQERISIVQRHFVLGVSKQDGAEIRKALRCKREVFRSVSLFCFISLLTARVGEFIELNLMCFPRDAA